MRVQIVHPNESSSPQPPIFVVQGTYDYPARVVALLISPRGIPYLGENLISSFPSGSKLWAMFFSAPGHSGLSPGDYTLVAFDWREPLKSMSEPVPVRVARRTVSHGPPTITFPRANDTVGREFFASGTHTTPTNVASTMECVLISGTHLATSGRPSMLGDLGNTWMRQYHNSVGSRIACTPLSGGGTHNTFTHIARDGAQQSTESPVTVTDLWGVRRAKRTKKKQAKKQRR